MSKKVAVITGGTKGIGLAISMQLAREGYALALMGTSGEAEIAKSLEGIRAFNHPVLYYQGSLGQTADREGFLQGIVERYGQVDILVNNAGVAPRTRMDLLETTEESYDWVMDINLKGTFFLTQAVAREMIKGVQKDPAGRPVIIMISSISEYTTSINRGEYCISKAGVGMLTQLMADRLADEGILVYGIRPGIIRTDMTKGVEEKYDRLIAEGLLPIKRWGSPQDIADAVSVLCSGRLQYSTGQVLDIDGGFHIRRL